MTLAQTLCDPSLTPAKIHQAESRLRNTIFGQDDVIRLSLIGILSGGHLLYVGMPGVAKTKLILAIGSVLGLSSKRVQCTPDLQPSDILGEEVIEDADYGKKNRRFIKGPIFTQLLMVDEINRASPRTQSALLQAMQERVISVFGSTFMLPEPFHVLATQNPVDLEGTYPLPEAQLDRFILKIDVPYLDANAERQMLFATTTGDEPVLEAALPAEDLRLAQKRVRQMVIKDELVSLILTVVRQARPDISDNAFVRQFVKWGPSPRATQALSLACRARAFLEGRTEATIDDIRELMLPVIGHRLILNERAAADNVSAKTIINDLKTRLIEGCA